MQEHDGSKARAADKSHTGVGTPQGTRHSCVSVTDSLQLWTTKRSKPTIFSLSKAETGTNRSWWMAKNSRKNSTPGAQGVNPSTGHPHTVRDFKVKVRGSRIATRKRSEATTPAVRGVNPNAGHKNIETDCRKQSQNMTLAVWSVNPNAGHKNIVMDCQIRRS